MAKEDRTAADLLMAAGIRSAAVFHLHLAAEKGLKALLTEADGGRPAPLTHNLRRLADMTGLPIPAEMRAFLVTLSPHAVSARYSLTEEGYTSSFCNEVRGQLDQLGTWLRQNLS